MPALSFHSLIKFFLALVLAAFTLAGCGGGGGDSGTAQPTPTATPTPVPPVGADTVRIHYQRAAKDYADWGLHLWGTDLNLPREVTWTTPWQPSGVGSDSFGIFFDVPVKATATGFNFIIHKGDSKNVPQDLSLSIATDGKEIWQLQDDATLYKSAPQPSAGNIAKAKAHWVTADTILWPGQSGGAGITYQLTYANAGGIVANQTGIVGGVSVPLNYDATGFTPTLAQKYPHLAGAGALKLAAANVAAEPNMLKGQLVVARIESGKVVDATALQTPGVLDSLFNYTGVLGTSFAANVPTFRLWAPTAQAVKLNIYNSADSAAPAATSTPMSFDGATGVWSLAGDASQPGKYYAYEVKVYVRSTGKVETNLVTDPYSLGLSANGARSLVVDLANAASQPAGWDSSTRPSLAAPEDMAIYELHVRDFSINDATVVAADRGKFKAFANTNSNGMKHLSALAQAGLTHIHLLPMFDIASVPETSQQTPVIDAAAGPASSTQQAAVAAVKDQDGFNWGYDPVHYTTPDGSYASDPNGVARIVEFRQMVQSLHAQGLRVVMDVVYNHTSSRGQNANSVLDKIVPDYYYRLNDQGDITSSSCCSDTASEHAMMEKLMIDSTTTWASQYKVDGFRFDIMGFHSKATLQKLQSAVQAVEPSIYLYGEGWNFGDVANDKRFVQATQKNLVGTGIGSFNDRLRDAVRGGGPFDSGQALLDNQGFANGLWYDNSGGRAQSAAQRDALLHSMDLIRVGLAGGLKDFAFTDKDGRTVPAAQIDYFGQPAGYTADPQELINYVSAHDNETIFDINQYRLPVATSMADRVRANNLALSIVALAQGIPFFHAGDDMLRSKSFDKDSYNAGDWFNKLDFSYTDNNWGVGLPSADKNQASWSVMTPLLQNPLLKPAPGDIVSARDAFRDVLKIRKSSKLFRLNTAADINARMKFYNTGTAQTPGVIAYSISGTNLDPNYKSVFVVFNADKVAQTVTAADYAGRSIALHPVQQGSTADAVVKTASFNSTSGVFTIPARTTAVFVEQ